MSISKFTAALASGSTELTLALANLNFDVSLVRMEAPEEYRPVELALSRRTKRTAEAEIQPCARKLQALFSPVLPRVQQLVYAYGKRASEIAEASRLEQADSPIHGPFSDHVGIDGGSLWAAANSGQGAIAVHLLACMLARMFTAAEATSIWEEIVAFRRDEILAQEEARDPDPGNVFAVLAAKTPLSRQSLAKWDDSARAWLRSADSFMGKKHKQLLLIINNINLAVDRHDSTYSDVIQAWTRAMVAVDKLVRGEPHSITDAAVLVAISAWHLYPDMMVLGERSSMVRQNDDLMKTEGILTLGLQSRSTQQVVESGRGVSWSLPLACYYFYGNSFTADRSLIETGARLTILEFSVLTVGSLFSWWSERRFGPLEAARVVHSVWHALNRPSALSTDQLPSQDSWLALIFRASEVLLQSTGSYNEELIRLFKYGARNCSGILGLDERRDSTFVRLQDAKTLLRMIPSVTNRIRLLRRFARRLHIRHDRLLIRYALLPSHPGRPKSFGYATVATTAQGNACTELHLWDDSHEVHTEKGEIKHSLISEDIVRAPHAHEDERFFWKAAPLLLSPEGHSEILIDDFFGKFAEFALRGGKVDKNKPGSMSGVPYHYIFGDPDIAAIYETYNRSPSIPSYLNAEEVELCADEGEIDAPSLLHFIGAIVTPKSRGKGTSQVTKHIRSLKALATIGAIYKDLPGATLDMRASKLCLADSRWMLDETSATVDESEQHGDASPDIPREVFTKEDYMDAMPPRHKSYIWDAFEPLTLTRPAVFACIAMFESGSVNIGTHGLESVMAVSSGNSIYTATELLQDPTYRRRNQVTRIGGNIGRPGITMMIPPQSSLRRRSIGDWKVIEHAYMDDKAAKTVDVFTATSLHLSFTDYSLTIDTGARGVRSSEVQLVETVISVHDRGRWVADLDILAALSSPLMRCVEDARVSCCHTSGAGPATDIVSLDSWEEFLDCPKEDAVLRSYLNWQARLAGTALSVARGDLTVILGKSTCWICGEAERNRFRHKKRATYIM